MIRLYKTGDAPESYAFTTKKQDLPEYDFEVFGNAKIFENSVGLVLATNGLTTDVAKVTMQDAGPYMRLGNTYYKLGIMKKAH